MNRRILVISLILAIFTDIGAYLDSLFYQWMSRNSPLKYQFRPMNFYEIVAGFVFSLFLYLILVSLYYSYLRPVKEIKTSPSLEATSLRHSMLPSAFISVGFFTIVSTLGKDIAPLIVIVDSVILWWISVLFLTTLKDSFLNGGIQ
jgi:hypothetical protein